MKSGFVFGTLVLAALVPPALVVACGVANEPGSYGIGPDGGVFPGPDGGPPVLGDSGAVFVDSGSVEDAAPPFVGPTTILAVHASANLFDYRLCFGVSSDGGTSSILPVPAYPDDPSQPMPETNYPGVPVGGAAPLPPLALSTVTTITPYVVSANELEQRNDLSTNPAETTCDQLICSGPSCLSASFDYFELPSVLLPVSAAGGTIVLAVEGCIPVGGSVAQCGAAYTATAGNLTAYAAALATSEDAGAWSLQLAQLSPSYGALVGDDASTTLTLVDPALDATVPLTAPTGQVGAPQITLPLSEAGVASAYLVLAPASASPLSQSLASIQYFQSPASNPFTYFNAPVPYFTAIVGDVTDAAAPFNLPDGAPNPQFDGHGLHVIAYPQSN